MNHGSFWSHRHSATDRTAAGEELYKQSLHVEDVAHDSSIEESDHLWYSRTTRTRTYKLQKIWWNTSLSIQQ